MHFISVVTTIFVVLQAGVTKCILSFESLPIARLVYFLRTKLSV